MVSYVLLRPLRPELDVSWSNIIVLPFYLLLLFYFSSHDLFSNWYFRNLHGLGYPKIVTICWFTDFWVNKSLSMMWGAYSIKSCLAAATTGRTILCRDMMMIRREHLPGGAHRESFASSSNYYIIMGKEVYTYIAIIRRLGGLSEKLISRLPSSKEGCCCCHTPCTSCTGGLVSKNTDWLASRTAAKVDCSGKTGPWQCVLFLIPRFFHDGGAVNYSTAPPSNRERTTLISNGCLLFIAQCM
jgi:hypothetical protein